MEIPTSAKVRFTTSKGNIDVELYAHELPASCRAFLQNCIDNKYAGLEFGKIEPLHVEVTPKSFDTKMRREFHSRVKFSARGNIALLNIEDSPLASADGFFITLKPQPDFNNRYVVVGKVVGDLIYNVVKILEGETMEDGVTPKYAVRITGVEVLQPYFEDLKKAENKVEVREPLRKKAKPAVKLSYDDVDDDGDVEDDEFVMKSAHELLNSGKKKREGLTSVEEKTIEEEATYIVQGDGKNRESEKGEKDDDSEKNEKDVDSEQNDEKVTNRDSENMKEDTKDNQEENEGSELSKPQDTSQDFKPEDSTEYPQDKPSSDSSDDSSDEEMEPKPDPSVDPHDPVIDVWKDTVDFSTLQNHRYVCR